MRDVPCRPSPPSWPILLVLIALVALLAPRPAAGQDAPSAAEVYDRACANCHGADGTGRPRHVVGFAVPLPDFTDCSFATREPDADWYSVAHEGGPVRGFNARMPAHGGALTPEEIDLALAHVRTFCPDRAWPRGELNLPRPLITEKAYPEDEAVFTTTVDAEGDGAVEAELLYEKRFGARNQVELAVPLAWEEQRADAAGPGADTGWEGGVGNVAVAVKRALHHSLERGSIVSATAEMILPTGDQEEGMGDGITVFEPFLTFGQILPRDSFVQLQGGAEIPLEGGADDEAFLRMALGKSFEPRTFGRVWTPMVEVLAARDLASEADTHWDVVPEMQVTLNTRQHVMANVGVRIPLDDTASRDTQVLAYLLWDWFDGGLLDGWRSARAETVPRAAVAATGPEALFAPASDCMGCHNLLTAPGGEDVSIGFDWRGSMMANAARDPYWQAAVRREVTDHPEAAAAIEHECSACHMPMTRFAAKAAGGRGEVFAHLPVATTAGAPPAALLAADGVSCTLCHQVRPDGLGTDASFTAGFAVDTATPAGERAIFGPFEVDAGRRRLMRSASRFQPEQGLHLQGSELCASCHTLYTHALGPGGEVIGELPEQVPYLEWRHSEYARTNRGCQSCHMPVVAGETAIAGVMGQPRPALSRHVFRGGNFFMPRVLNAHSGELGVAALPQELDATAMRTGEHLQASAARVALEEVAVADGTLAATVAVTNLAGHKLPSAYPSRRAWLHVTVRDGRGEAVFESGALAADGAIAGNDNDADPERYEPHWTVIDRPGQVAIYETVLAGPDGGVTTGLLTATRYLKDNRLLPAGFDKATAEADVAVRGEAAADPDFLAGGDRTRYRVDVTGREGPFTVEAELWYQPVAFRWARNLAAYDAPEPRRFGRYYDRLADLSGIPLARARATVP